MLADRDGRQTREPAIECEANAIRRVFPMAGSWRDYSVAPNPYGGFDWAAPRRGRPLPLHGSRFTPFWIAFPLAEPRCGNMACGIWQGGAAKCYAWQRRSAQRACDGTNGDSQPDETNSASVAMKLTADATWVCNAALNQRAAVDNATAAGVRQRRSAVAAGMSRRPLKPEQIQDALAEIRASMREGESRQGACKRGVSAME